MPARKSDPRTKSRTETHIDWSRLHREAAERFGVKHFRPGQRELLEAIMAGRDVVGVMATGGGKSLTFQLPSLLLPNAVVVVSPLISLMQDQAEKAEEADIAAATLNSTISTRETREQIHEIRRGEHNLIYVTPERLENSEYVDHLRDGGVSLLVLDEAHCISQWGHDFRPSYLGLRRAARDLGRPPIAALTATATPEVTEDIVRQLDLQNPVVVNTGIERYNLFFEVRRTVNSAAKREQLLELIRSEQGTGIVYTATVRTASEVCRWLEDENIPAANYHSRITAKKREGIQQKFMNNEYRVLVATKAFGLGIDKPDIRYVVHYNFPDSLESYYQEAGRAGRDGKPARASLLYRLEDRRVQGYFLGGRYPRREHSLKLYETLNAMAEQSERRNGIATSDLVEASGLPARKAKVVIAQLEAAGIIAYKNRNVVKLRDFASPEEFNSFLNEYENRGLSDRERLATMMRYAQTAACRMRFLREYFGDEAGEDCGHCDNCAARGEGRLGPSPTVIGARRTGNGRDATQHNAQAVDATTNPAAPDAPPPPEFLASVLTEPPKLFSIGDPVRHKRFGEGKVMEISGDRVTADFADSGTKSVKAEYLSRAA